MKNIFRFVLIVSFTFNLIACGRVGSLIPYEGYVPTFDTIDTNNFNKDDLEKLSDSDLIFKAIDLGLNNKIVFSGDDALDPDIPSYKKDLGNREELIKILLEAIEGNKVTPE